MPFVRDNNMDGSDAKFRGSFHAGCYNDLLQLADGKLQTEDGFTFDIHRVMLAGKSEYFRAMFCRIDRDEKIFTIPGISAQCLSDILSYVYTADIFITEHNIADLLIAADYLLLSDLYQAIKKRIKDTLAPANCLRLFQAALDMNDDDISSQSFRFIQTCFGSCIVRNQMDELVGLPPAILENILSSRSLCVRDESTVWQVIIEWTKEDWGNRLKHFPRLLTLLAKNELGERLASEILHCRTTAENAFLPDLFEMGQDKKFTTDLEVIQGFLEKHEGMDYRIPPRLYVIAVPTFFQHYTLYVTYDEKIDLWRKIGETSLVSYFMTAVGNTIILLGERECLKFDLTDQQWTPVRSFRDNIKISNVVEIDGKMFVLGDIPLYRSFGFEVYDPETDVWSVGFPLPDSKYASAAAVSRNIYIVGSRPNSYAMITFVLKTDQWKWHTLPTPKFYRREFFFLVAFHDNLYVFGGSSNTGHVSKVEVFFTETNTWQELPDLPYTYELEIAIVWEDQLIIFEEYGHGENVTIINPIGWNEEMHCWENKHFRESTLKDFLRHQFCEVKDVNAVRCITRKNRDPETKFERIHFSS